MNIGKNIKELRSRKGLTQKDLAEKLNVTPQAVSRWELDTVEPSLDTMKEMAELFGVTMDQLMSENLEVKENKENPSINIVLGETNNNAEESIKKEDIQEVVENTLPIVGVCSVCGKPIHAGEGHERVMFGGKIKRTCDECEAKRIAEKNDTDMRKFKRTRNAAYIVSSILGALVLALFLTGAITNPNTESLGADIGISIALGVVTFTTLFCIIMRNNFIGEMWLGIASWGCVKLPGIIFSLSFNGIVFLILTKILFFILSAILVVGAMILATSLAVLCSLFVFPVSVYWAHKRPEKTIENFD